MSTSRASPPKHRRRRRLRRAGLVAAVLMALLVAVLWSVRDRPRRLLERDLGAALGARVRIARLEVGDAPRLRLVGVRADRFRQLPQIRQLEVDSIGVYGGWGAILRRHLEELALEGVTVRLEPFCEGAPSLELPPSTLTYQRLRADRLTLELSSADVERGGRGNEGAVERIRGRMTLTSNNGSKALEGALESERLSVERWLGLLRPALDPSCAEEPSHRSATVRLEETALSVEISSHNLATVWAGPWLGTARWSADRLLAWSAGVAAAADGAAKSAPGGATWSEDALATAVRFGVSEAGSQTVAAQTELAAIDRVAARWTASPGGGEPSLSLDLEGVDLAALSAVFSPFEDLALRSGRADVHLESSADTRLVLRARDLEVGGEALAGSTLRRASLEAKGRLGAPLLGALDQLEERSLEGEGEAMLVVPSFEGGAAEGWSGLPRESLGTLPLTARLGTHLGDGHASGTLDLEDGARHRLLAEGSYDLAAGLLEARWRFGPTPVESLSGLLALPSFEGLATGYLPGLLGDSALAANGTFAGPIAHPTIAADLQLAELSAHATLDLARRELTARWSLAPTSMVRVADALRSASKLPAGWSLAGTLQGSGGLSGSLDALDRLSVTADGAVSDLEVGGSPSDAEEPVAQVHSSRLDWSLRSQPSARAGVASLDGVLELAAPELEPRSITLTAEATMDGWRPSRAELSLDAGALGTSTLAAELSGPADAQALEARGTWHHAGLEVGEALRWLGPRLGRPLGAGEARGVASADLGWSWTGSSLTAGGEVGVADGSLTSGDGSRVVQGIAPRFILRVSGEPGGAWQASADGRVEDFLGLWETTFADFTGVGVDVRAEATLRPSPTSGDSDALALAAQLDLAGDDGELLALRLLPRRLDAPTVTPWQSEVRLRIPDLDAALGRYLRGPLRGAASPLESLHAAGEARAELRAALRPIPPKSAPAGPTAPRPAGGSEGLERSSNAFSGSVEGGVWLESHDVSLGELSARRLQWHLPLDLAWQRYTGTLELSGPVRVGRLGFEGLRLADVELAPIDAPVVVEGARVRLERPLQVALFDGTVALDRATLDLSPHQEPTLVTAVALHALDLGKMTEAAGLFPLEGSVEARFPEVRLSPSSLTTEGGGEIALWGGRIAVDGIQGSDLTSPFPRLQLSARLEAIELAQLTSTLEFGEITGLAQGRIDDLVLVAGAPVRFHALLESVPEQVQRRRVSIKAVNNISRLATGVETGALKRGIYRLFDSFPYQGLGVELTLRQDDFLLRGLLRRGERELFLKGGFPLRLDVVNVRPGARVSFKTMMSRLGNLEVRRGKKAEESTP